MRLESPVFAEEVTYLINFCILNRALPSGGKTASLLSLNRGLTQTKQTTALSQYQGALATTTATAARTSQKHAKGLISKTTTLHMHVHHAFLYISLLSLKDYGVKIPNFTFYGERTMTSDNDFFFSFKT